jgi:glycosyltransferase involved in cell wall biosynthesis
VYWFPNTRRFAQIEPENGNRPGSCRRFIFVGRVSEVKGIREILDVDEHLSDSVSIMVFGPFTGKISQKDFEGRKRVHYGGVLQPEEVTSTLRQYDALLLPTYFPREGYPGVIIEAYGVGMPVICSRWQAIPEIVDETSGILIPPRNSCALLEAIQALAQDEEWYTRLRAGARNRREEFASEQWADRFVEYCRGLVQRER